MCNMLGQIYTERDRDRERQRDRKREREIDFLDSASLRSKVTNARRVPASSSVHEGYRLFPRQRFPFNLANVFQGISDITMSEAVVGSCRPPPSVLSMCYEWCRTKFVLTIHVRK